ncbi:hypothetical protein BAUCODRAFT_481296 [Baudoinia panamericana UAMH 10762]|uniref:Uncharacterized protein n=1 Tax=Baudoinia panamericana (strain UAMH 10762) TaxID=717646 RepID=M2MYC9_BAUPA|nr:uncharacterized protein BAUCODRAFT_481296 [Baudoinia panamericana UAMH 10762]EMC96578.1 hypothetical protein BAUCODRAFT_481296 [Baudoinia panamericana UAMH 10762]
MANRSQPWLRTPRSVPSRKRCAASSLNRRRRRLHSSSGPSTQPAATSFISTTAFIPTTTLKPTSTTAVPTTATSTSPAKTSAPTTTPKPTPVPSINATLAKRFHIPRPLLAPHRPTVDHLVARCLLDAVLQIAADIVEEAALPIVALLACFRRDHNIIFRGTIRMSVRCCHGIRCSAVRRTRNRRA